MGQITKYVEGYQPPLVNRIFGVVVSVTFIVRAAVVHTFENSLWAILLAVTMLPYAIAPEATKNRGVRWERDHPIQVVAFMTLTAVCGFFLILRWFLDRPHSLLIAVPLALAYATVLTYAMVHRRQR
ncbi:MULTISPECIES: hypothetical protein [Kribbella]|jgi:hypothetical protein|uniref:DUF3147 family protein n=1 Tax=Kribbella karoonensis TaxID=324851 RepID=A0ABN2DET3_9ACTN